MAKRTYQPKAQPIAVQIHVQKAVVAQCENALNEARRIGDILADKEVEAQRLPGMPLTLIEAVSIIATRERELEDAQKRLAELEGKT